MKTILGFLKSKVFYIALSLGLIAFATLITVQDYKTSKKEIEQQKIDLNKPLMSDNSDETDINANTKEASSGNDAIKSVSENVTSQTDKTAKEDTTSQTDKTVKEDTTSQTDKTAKEDTTSRADKTAAEATASQTDKLSEDNEDLSATGEVAVAENLELQVPIVGTTIIPYSMETTVFFSTLDTYRCSPGMVIAANEGDDIVSAADGTVTAIEETKEFGTVMTIDMGNGYEAKYGQLMNLCVQEGDLVIAGQNIAEVAPVSSYYSNEGTNLYFQVNKDGNPVNPMTLIE